MSFVALTAIAFAPLAKAQQSGVQLDSVQTQINFTLGADFHTVHGAFKLKSGAIQFDPSTGKASGLIVVDAASGESGNASRDRKMDLDVLKSGQFAEIIFVPEEVKGTLLAIGSSHLEVTGRLQLLGRDHEVTLPIDVLANGQELELTTRLLIPYVQWGLKNPSTLILRVSDKVTIEVHSVAHLVSP